MQELSNIPSSARQTETNRSVTTENSVASRPRVLVVEDNVINQTLVKTYLDKLDCVVQIAANGEEAIESLQRESFNLIFMDVQMPVMCGLEATSRIRALDCQFNAHKLPIIAMTAGSVVDDKKCCVEAGMNDYLSKPISRDAIAKMLNLWLKSESN